MKDEKRSYTLGKRAEKQAETRQKIVEAAVELHGTVGPARTTIAMLADRAGVQRHTVYAHFPDDRSLLMACSGHVDGTDPMPDPAPWRAIADARARLRTALGALYRYYARHERLTAVILRDMETDETLREVTLFRRGPVYAAYREVLGEGLDPAGRAALNLALTFHTWRTLTAESGLAPEAAVELMVRAVRG